MSATTVLITMAILGVVGLALANVERFVGRVSKRVEETVLYSHFMDDARRRGLSHLQTMEEWRVRTALAEFRDKASAAVRANPADWMGEIERETQAAIDRMKDQDPRLIPALAGTITSLPYNHILYQAETSMVDQMMRQRDAWAEINDPYQVAALRIVRPSR